MHQQLCQEQSELEISYKKTEHVVEEGSNVSKFTKTMRTLISQQNKHIVG